MTTNGEWLFSKPFEEQVAWMDEEHHDDTLDGDTDALERKSADLIHEYYKPMVSELQAKVDELQEKLRISWECECKLQAERDNLAADLLKANNERERYRSMCSDMATKIHDALMIVDEGMA